MKVSSSLQSMLFYLAALTGGFAGTLLVATGPSRLAAYLGIAFALLCVGAWVCGRLHVRGELLESTVAGAEGLCVPVWLNGNRVNVRFYGVTGFFRAVSKIRGLPLYFAAGKEFHGKVEEGHVNTTALVPPNDLDCDSFAGTTTGRFSAVEVHHSNRPQSA